MGGGVRARRCRLNPPQDGNAGRPDPRQPHFTWGPALGPRAEEAIGASRTSATIVLSSAVQRSISRRRVNSLRAASHSEAPRKT